MTKQLNGYLRQAKKNLCCEKEAQAVFEQRVYTAVSDIQAERPDISWEECVEILGTPEQMAEEYMQEFSSEYVSGYLKKQHRKRMYSAVASVIMIIVLLGLTSYWWFVKTTRVVENKKMVMDWDNVGYMQTIPNMLEENKEE